ncbi:MAG: O-methyltransferase [Bacteroidales bacterium]|nr:O-methyltransferase [Bacteroidales bacterium]
MDFIPKEIEDYALAHSEAESKLLQEIEREAHIKTLMPRMISGNLQGKFLGLLATIAGAKNILEIGGFTGYSAIAVAEQTPDNCLIHTLEINPEYLTHLRKNILKSGFDHRIKIYEGNALEIVPKLDFIPDLVFLDADKENYLTYYQMVINILQSGGIIVADNVLWSGKVLTEPQSKDKETKGLQDFNQFVQSDSRVTNLLIPIRDGLMMIRKK